MNLKNVLLNVDRVLNAKSTLNFINVLDDRVDFNDHGVINIIFSV